jgi:hypothetical protein
MTYSDTIKERRYDAKPIKTKGTKMKLLAKQIKGLVKIANSSDSMKGGLYKKIWVKGDANRNLSLYASCGNSLLVVRTDIECTGEVEFYIDTESLKRLRASDTVTIGVDGLVMPWGETLFCTRDTSAPDFESVIPSESNDGQENFTGFLGFDMRLFSRLADCLALASDETGKNKKCVSKVSPPKDKYQATRIDAVNAAFQTLAVIMPCSIR